MNEKGIWSIEEAASYDRFDATLAKCIVDTFSKPAKVNDIGCGQGRYCSYFEKAGWPDVGGYEGTPNTWGVFNNIKQVDLSVPCSIPKSDFVLSLEVGEHIPSKYENVFIQNITKSCTGKLIVSWALPEQGGPGHVNGRSNEYIIDKIVRCGFKYNKEQSEVLRESASLSWLKHTIMVFDKLTIGALTMWYNEEFLAPFFLEHYSYLDNIHIIIDADTTDKTREIALKYPNVTIEEYRFPDGWNDALRTQKFNEVAKTLTTDWLYVVDVDEFIFPPNDEDPRVFLSRQTGNVSIAKMWYVFRNVKDKDLDPTIKPIHYQRRYGDPNRETGSNAMYNNKPIIIKQPLEFALGVGNHTISGTNIIYCKENFDGTHWSSADAKFCIDRRIKNRRPRQSKINIENKWSFHEHDITSEKIIATCAEHLNDPELFKIPIKPRILLCGFDTPTIPTGYASTCNSVAQGLIRRGYDVYSIGGNLEPTSGFDHNNIHVLSNLVGMYPNKETFLKHYNDVKPDIVIFHNDLYRVSYITDLPDDIQKKTILWLPVEKIGANSTHTDALNKLRHVAVVSDFAYQSFKDKVSCNLYKIYHQVDTSIYKPLPKEKTGIFTVIRTDKNQPRKLWWLTFKVWQQFSKDKTDVKFIAKTNPFDCTGKNLIETVKKLGIESSVVWNADFVTQEKMNSLYSGSNVFLSTSGSEGFGLALAEASASGLPVVAPNYPPIDEILNFGKSGRLIDIKETFWSDYLKVNYDAIDIDNAVKHLNELYDMWKNNNQELIDIGQQGRDYVVGRYDIERVIDSWCEVFEKMKTPIFNDGIDRLEVGIVTHNRQDYLACLLTSLLAQTYQNYDVFIMDNDTDESMINNKLIMSLLRRFEVSGHTWRLWRGSPNVSFPISHQTIFNSTKCKYVFKLDDDLILENTCLERLMAQIKSDDNIAAVGGIFLQPAAPIEAQHLPPNVTPTMNVLYNNVQWYKQPTNAIIDAEHLYSSYIYRRRYMDEIGGFPQNLSKLAFREDTITTHKMYKKGHKLCIVPDAILFHFQNSSGGMRAISDEIKGKMAHHDSLIFEEQLRTLNP